MNTPPTAVNAAPDQPWTGWDAAELAPLIGTRRPARSGIAVIIPARDERDGLRAALESLTSQSLRPDLVTVVVNNSTDDTAAIACAYARGRPWVTVLVMPGRNAHKKAGALNYGIASLLDAAGRLPSSVRLLVTMDGDSVLHRRFCERASRVMTRDPGLGGVSAACLAKDEIRGGPGRARLLHRFQRIEYGRASYGRVLRSVHTMSGAGSVYRATAVNAVLASRLHLFAHGSLVEDYEAGLWLKRLGWRITANQNLIVYTDLMDTLAGLIAQRVRWTRGTVDEWRRYGPLSRVCRRSVAATALTLAGFGYLWARVAMIAVAAAGGGSVDARALAFTGVLWAGYQAVTVRAMGWRTVLFEVVLLPEIAYAVLRAWWTVRALAASFAGAAPAWR